MGSHDLRTANFNLSGGINSLSDLTGGGVFRDWSHSLSRMQPKINL